MKRQIVDVGQIADLLGRVGVVVKRIFVFFQREFVAGQAAAVVRMVLDFTECVFEFMAFREEQHQKWQKKLPLDEMAHSLQKKITPKHLNGHFRSMQEPQHN